MPSEGRHPTRLIRLAGLLLAVIAFAVLMGAAPPPAHLPATVLQFVDAPSQGSGSTGPNFLGLLLVGALGLVAIGALVAAFVLFRTRGAKAVPAASAEGWWTCSKCGAGNMDGAARCHACATWRTSTPHPTASPTP